MEGTCPTEVKESSASARNRQEVIKMARQMLADKRGDSELKTSLPVNDGFLFSAGYVPWPAGSFPGWDF